VLIGAEGAGEAYLFNLTGTLLTTFTNPAPSGDSFGTTVAAVGNGQVLIGAYNFTAFYQGQPRQIGRAYLFATNGTLLTTFTNPSPASVQAFSFGGMAALGSDCVIIAGVPDVNIGAPYSGGVFLYRTNGALITTFTNPTPAVANEFGIGMSALGSDRVIIGAPYATPLEPERRIYSAPTAPS
jgi:outer membrane protein assembly factor BamB